ncbi:MAG TPA: hypothetical protein VKR83_05895 [Ktedonobacteraceae bacterium]|nr:hypothetical protein [Ktedonobacteraceae bacterium]
MNEPMSHDLRARAELKRRKNLGEGIDGEPKPQDLFGAAEPGAQFIQLQVREVEVGEESLVQGLLCWLLGSSVRKVDGLAFHFCGFTKL